MSRGATKLRGKATEENKMRKTFRNIEDLFQCAEFLRKSGKLKEAFVLYKEAAERGDRDAQNNVGTMYLEGMGTKRDVQEAVRWYRVAADLGHPVAQYNLSVRLRVGDGVDLDWEESAKWLTAASENGYVEALNDLGVAYRYGRGVRKEPLYALRLFKAASDAGDLTASANFEDLCRELAIDCQTIGFAIDSEGTGASPGEDHSTSYSRRLTDSNDEKL